MPNPLDESSYCHRCGARLSRRRLKITESVAMSSGVIEWDLCSWACARELVILMVRVGRDER